MKPSFRAGGWWPLTLALVWLAITGWARPLAVPDEGRYVGVAWSMLTSGDWLVPRLNGLPYFHKPPLFYWITAASLSALGHVEWAARVAPLLGAAAGTTAMYLFARRWWSESSARLALLVLVTQPLAFIGAQFANLDMLVAGCIAVTIFSFAHAALLRAAGEPIPRRVLVTGYLFTALGVLAKGLIGIVLPGGVLVVWLLAWRKPRIILSLLWWPGFVLFLLVAGPWFVLMQREFAQFSYYFFYVQHFERFAQGGFNNQQPVYFYPVVLLVLALPWSLWLLAGLRRRGQATDPVHAGTRWMLWTWVAVITLFFSLPKSKLVGYILPVAWPIALLVADGFARAAPAAGRRLAWWRASAAAAVLVCLGAVAFHTVHPVRSLRPLGEALYRHAAPGDQVMFLDGAYFDIPFYARLRAPALMVEQWDSPQVQKVDNWRKEVADAGYFAPALARRVLLLPADVPAALCSRATTWVLGGRDSATLYPVLAAAEVVAQDGGTNLWRVPGLAAGVSRPGCPGTPSATPAGKS